MDGCRKLRTCSWPFEVEPGWLYDIRFRWPSGRPFREKKKVPVSGLSEKRALAWATERRNAILAAGERQDADRKEAEKPEPAPTLAAFKDAYLRHRRNQRLKASTEAGRELQLRRWILPVLGSYRLDAIDASAIDLLKEEMEERSEKYVNNVLGTLSNIVRTAKRLRVIREMPIDGFGLFKVDASKPPAFYSEEEYGRLVDAALESPGRSRAPSAAGKIVRRSSASLRPGRGPRTRRQESPSSRCRTPDYPPGKSALPWPPASPVSSRSCGQAESSLSAALPAARRQGAAGRFGCMRDRRFLLYRSFGSTEPLTGDQI